jgi:hypothetical protein
MEIASNSNRDLTPRFAAILKRSRKIVRQQRFVRLLIDIPPNKTYQKAA